MKVDCVLALRARPDTPVTFYSLVKRSFSVLDVMGVEQTGSSRKQVLNAQASIHNVE
jgi:hypothetical protein